MIAYTVGWPELVIILAVLLLLFGARRLPEIARSLGRSTKEFRSGLKTGADEADEEAERKPEEEEEHRPAEHRSTE